MNLDVGKLTIMDAAQLGGLAVAALFVASLGGMMSWGAGPSAGETLVNLGGFRFWIWFFGTTVGLVSFGLGTAVVVLTVRSWLRYENRLEEWHNVAIDAVIDNDGIEISRTMTQWELNHTNPRDVLLTALAVHARHMAGEHNAHTVRELTGAVWLGNIRLGDVASGQGEHMSKTFRQLGLLKNVAPRKAGDWAVDGGPEKVIEIVTANWSKVGKL
jgi:hypothetical protein